MAKTQVHLLIKQTMDKYGVKGKDLAEVTGVGTTHISEIRSGKKWVSSETFVALLEGMDTLAPGSRHYFCQLLAGEELSSKKATVAEKIVELIEVANDDEIEAALFAIGRKWKRLRQRSASVSKGEEEREAEQREVEQREAIAV